ncbi:MAG: putative porin [Bacteroidales bacterium]|nr:putative porin [Bacteroidales bacterium]
MKLYIHLIFMLAAAVALPAFSQSQMSRNGGERGNGSSHSTSDNHKETTVYKPGSAWTLSNPLGTHEESTIDTLLYNYQRQFVPAMNSDAWATTGSFAAEGINMIYFDRPQPSAFLFEDALQYWLPTFAKEKFYNVYIPMTLLSYNFGGNRDNHTDRLKGIFAGNVNKKIGIGANIDYLYTKGAYNSQAAKNLIYGFQGYYNGDHYEMQAFLNHYNSQNQENGGITDDLYIEDPAVLQGGVDKIEPKSIPTRLNGAQNRLVGAEFYMSHAYKIGFWRDDTQEGDTVERRTLVPVTKFIYAFDYKYNHHTFKNTRADEETTFWQNMYFNPSATLDNTHYWSFSNTVGISMIEGFQKWAQFGLSAYATYEFDHFRQGVLAGSDTGNVTEGEETAVLTPLPEGFELLNDKKRNRLWIGGRLERMKGTHIRYFANAKFGLMGDAAGDLDVDGAIETRFKLGKDTVKISADGFFRNQTPSYLLRYYFSNHFVWNNDFGKIRSFRVGGKLHIPWTRTDLRAGVENVQNCVYFDQNSMPQQYGGSVQIFSAAIDQKLKFGIWNWNNTVTYQVSSNQDVIPLPALSIYSNMFLGFTAFRVLHMQLGVDCDYYTRYRGYAYQPATMSFHVQGENPVEVGNFAVANAYVTAKLYKVRFFVLWSHVNQGLFGRNYFSMPHYPIDPRQLRFGLSIDFAN